MKRALALPAALVISGHLAALALEPPRVGGACDGCDVMFKGMPAALDWQTVVVPPGTVGDPLEIEGVIYRKDGKTLAAGVILYVYQTDADGYYRTLRGWMKTDERGRYRFRTIRPGAYPDRDIPAHIHPIVKEPDKNEYYLDEYRFEDDPLLTKAKRDAHENRGGSGVVRLSKNTEGIWVGRRDIVLGLNIPSYP